MFTTTGKTLAFLIPACHKALEIPANQRRGKVSVLVVSPTRELCQQIYEEGRILCTHVALSLQCIYGGTNIKSDLSKFRRAYPDILIATPGRLNDHLQNYHLGEAMNDGLKVLIFDEADQARATFDLQARAACACGHVSVRRACIQGSVAYRSRGDTFFFFPVCVRWCT